MHNIHSLGPILKIFMSDPKTLNLFLFYNLTILNLPFQFKALNNLDNFPPLPSISLAYIYLPS